MYVAGHNAYKGALQPRASACNARGGAAYWRRPPPADDDDVNDDDDDDDDDDDVEREVEE